MNNKEVMQVIIPAASPSLEAGQVAPVSGTATSPTEVGISSVMYGSAPGTSPVQAERIKALLDNADNVAPSTDFNTGFGFAGTMARLTLWNEVAGSWDRVPGLNQGEVFPGVMLATGAALYAADASNAPTALRRADAAALAAYDSKVALLIAQMGEWSEQSAPALDTVATVSRAAVVGRRHVCRSICGANFSSSAGSAVVFLRLRDGAAGVGTILWQCAVRGGTSLVQQVTMAGLNIVGSLNTAMTLEFSAIGTTLAQQSVAITGYTAAA